MMPVKHRCLNPRRPPLRHMGLEIAAGLGAAPTGRAVEGWHCQATKVAAPRLSNIRGGFADESSITCGAGR